MKIDESGIRCLATAILTQAFEDYHYHSPQKRYPIYRAGVKRFLAGQWCRDLCDYLDIDYKMYIDRVRTAEGIQGKKRKKDHRS